MKKFKLKKRRFKPQKVWSSDRILEEIINSELRLYNKTIEDIRNLKDGIVEGTNTPWYQYYTFKTKVQEGVWEEYINKIVRRHYASYYISKKKARRLLSMAILNFGLSNEEYYKERHSED